MPSSKVKSVGRAQDYVSTNWKEGVSKLRDEVRNKHATQPMDFDAINDVCMSWMRFNACKHGMDCAWAVV